MVKAYWNKVGLSIPLNMSSQVVHIFPCFLSLRDLTFGVGENGTFTIPAANINLGPALLILGLTVPICAGGITELNGLGNVAVVGDVALRSALVVYDDGKNRIGWAKGT